MQVVLIGAGRLATQLGAALRGAGHNIMAVYSRTLAAAQTLAHVVGGSPTDQISALPLRADIFIIAVKDSALQMLIPQLVQGREDQLFVHTAGSMPMAVFEAYARRYGVLYPMQSFSKERPVDFSEIPVFIEGTDPMIRLLAESVSRRVYECSTADRKYLHLAAVFACNFANHCYALAADVLEQHGLPFDVMLPLIDETARKVHDLHPLDAQTGPAVRYDENVIRMQAALVSDPTVRDLYERLSQSIHQKATQHDQLRLTEDTGHRV